MDEDELIPLSALQHYQFCPRQCALIHVERQWRDNRLTAEGNLLHARVDGDAPRREVRSDKIIVRGLPVRSLSLGVVGKCDVVEFLASDTGVELPGMAGSWCPFPVEYKRGRAKKSNEDRVQLCAQAICLEEVFDTRISCGAIFYGKTQRRHDVEFSSSLREQTRRVAHDMAAMITSGATPSATRQKKCDSCSLLELCLPFERKDASKSYVNRSIRTALETGE